MWNPFKKTEVKTVKKTQVSKKRNTPKQVWIDDTEALTTTTIWDTTIDQVISDDSFDTDSSFDSDSSFSGDGGDFGGGGSSSDW